MEQVINQSNQTTADDILNFNDQKTITIEVASWGNKKLTLKNLSALDREEIIKASKKPDGDMDTAIFNAMLIIKCCVSPKFEPRQCQALAMKDANVLAEIASQINKLSNIESIKVVKKN